MATSTIRDLTALGVSKLLSAKKAGRFRVSRHLYLQTKPSGAGSWLFRYADRQTGKNRWCGLGRAKLFTLSEARLRAARLEKQIAEGLDPLTVKREGRRVEKAAEHEQRLATISFKRTAQEFMKTRWQSWSAIHRNSWASSMIAHCYPHIGDMPVGAITSDDVIRCLTANDLWVAHTETASRLRGKIEQTLDFARACGYRTGENAAAWKGNLSHRLAAPRKLRRVEHFKALAHERLPALMARLERRAEPGAAALRFAILTASRTGEVLGATWGEVDLEKATWTIPATRMKAKREHRVALSVEALECLGDPGEADEPLFRHVFNDGHMRRLGPNAMMAIMRGLAPGATVHGCRSSFRDWAGDATDHQREVVEAALAHALGDSTERAYRRGAPGGRHLVVRDGRMHLTLDPERHSCRPSVDALFESVAAAYGASAAACLLTGMGKDGALGLLKIRASGGLTIAQDEATSVIYGMPREAIILGGATLVLPIGDIGPRLAALQQAEMEVAP
jgi:integrase